MKCNYMNAIKSTETSEKNKCAYHTQLRRPSIDGIYSTKAPKFYPFNKGA